MDYEQFDSQEGIERSKTVERTKDEILELQKTFDVWGHGVETEDVANKILLDGFVTSWETLISFAYQFASYSEGIKKMVRGWDYHAREFKVIIATPRGMWSSETDHELAVSETHRYLFDDVLDDDDLRCFGKYKIEPDKIVGYINERGELVRNVSFDSERLHQEYSKKRGGSEIE
jgi:hypothetical protein